MADATESFNAILRKLDRFERVGGTAASRLPKAQTGISLREWHEPPDKREILKNKSQLDVTKPFVEVACGVSKELSEPKYIKPKVLDEWTQKRVVQPERSYAKMKGIPPMKFSGIPEVFPDPKDSQLGPMHRDWLQKHRKQRDTHIYQVHTAKQQVKRAQAALARTQEWRELTRDRLTSRDATPLEFSGNVRQKLKNVRHIISVSHTWSHGKPFSLKDMQTKQEEDALRKAQSAPVLQVGETIVPGRARHLEAWANPNRIGRVFQESTPWRERAEENELRKRRDAGRITW
mmetsp:Transcript_10738/g.24498  ORF Transcript_10738/g.24498 Transcript_10738/m.24498 type:complete len:290 (+) Transcript_10738:22-891(+)